MVLLAICGTWFTAAVQGCSATALVLHWMRKRDHMRMPSPSKFYVHNVTHNICFMHYALFPGQPPIFLISHITWCGFGLQGLGKTLQTISLVAYLNEYRGIKGPHIVIVPKSTLGNWMNEFRRFCPVIRCIKFHGNAEERVSSSKHTAGGAASAAVWQR